MAFDNDQVFLGNFPFTRSPVQKLIKPAFEKGVLSKKTCQFISYTRKIKLVKEKLIKGDLASETWQGKLGHVSAGLSKFYFTC